MKAIIFKYLIITILALALAGCKEKSEHVLKCEYKYSIRLESGYHMKANDYEVKGPFCIFTNEDGYIIRVPLYSLTYIKEKIR